MAKKKSDVIEVEATVLETLPNAMFKVAINGADGNEVVILAHVSGKSACTTFAFYQGTVLP